MPELTEKLTGVEGELEANREEAKTKIAELHRMCDEEDGLLYRYLELRTQFERMNTEEVARLFESLDQARTQVETLEALDRRLADLLVALERVDPSTLLAEVDEIPEQLAAWWEEDLAGELDLQGLRAKFDDGIGELTREVEERRSKLATKLGEQRQHRDEIEESLRKETQADADASIRGQQREEARRRFEAVRAQRERYIETYIELDGCLKERGSLLEAMAEVRRDIVAARQEVAEDLTEQLGEISSDGPSVEIVVEEAGDRAILEAFFSSSGFLSQERAGQWRAQKIPERLAKQSPTEIVWAIFAESPQDLVADDGVSLEMAERFVGALALRRSSCASPSCFVECEHNPYTGSSLGTDNGTAYTSRSVAGGSTGRGASPPGGGRSPRRSPRWRRRARRSRRSAARGPSRSRPPAR